MRIIQLLLVTSTLMSCASPSIKEENGDFNNTPTILKFSYEGVGVYSNIDSNDVQAILVLIGKDNPYSIYQIVTPKSLQSHDSAGKDLSVLVKTHSSNSLHLDASGIDYQVRKSKSFWEIIKKHPWIE